MTTTAANQEGNSHAALQYVSPPPLRERWRAKWKRAPPSAPPPPQRRAHVIGTVESQSEAAGGCWRLGEGIQRERERRGEK